MQALAPVTEPLHSSAGRSAVTSAALVCIERDGVRNVTLAAVAAEAQVGRASIYRWFPGGRAEVLVAAGDAELERFLRGLHADLVAETTLESLLAHVLSASVAHLRSDPVLRQILDREPELVLPLLAFDQMGTAFAIGEMVLADHFSRLAPGLPVRPAAEWVTRIVLSHVVAPSAHTDLSDPTTARSFVEAHLADGLADLIPQGEPHVNH